MGSKFRPGAANLPPSRQSGYGSSWRKIISSFLDFIFQLLYHQFAWAYNYVAQIVSLGMWYQWVNAALPFLDRGPVLEIGFGTGRLLGKLTKREINVIGLDNSQNMVKISRSDLQKQGINPRLVNGSAQFLPFCNHLFQRIVSTFPSPYILEHQTLLEMMRVLSPGGLVVIIPTAWITCASLQNRLAAQLFRATHQATTAVKDLDDPFAGLTSGLRAIGFEVQLRIIELPQSKVLCILAKKPL